MSKFNKTIQLVLVCIALTTNGQQLPQYSDYMINYFALNPASAGTPGCLNAKIGHRTQWVGLVGAPQTTFFTLHSSFKKKRRMWINDKHAWGLKIESDATGIQGPISQVNVQGAYAYHKPIGSKTFLSVGVFAGVVNYNYKHSDIRLPQTAVSDDPITNGSSKNALLYPDINPGVMLYNNKGYIGYSLKNALRNKLSKVYGDKSNGILAFHHYLTFGYRFGKNNANISLIPSANIKLAGQLKPSFDLTMLVNFYNQIDVGLQYRYIDGINAIVNLKLKQLTIGYAYDYNLSAIKYGSGNGHEIIIGYRYCVGQLFDDAKKEQCPAYR